jgi:hypothetical protein
VSRLHPFDPRIKTFSILLWILSFSVWVWVLCYDRRSVGQSALERSTHLGLTTGYYSYYSLTITVLFLWGALSDERTGLSFVHATGPRQCSPSRVRDALVSWPYFTVSDLRLPFLSPPATRGDTVEVFDPASMWVISQSVIFTILIIFWPTT